MPHDTVGHSDRYLQMSPRVYNGFGENLNAWTVMVQLRLIVTLVKIGYISVENFERQLNKEPRRTLLGVRTSFHSGYALSRTREAASIGLVICLSDERYREP